MFNFKSHTNTSHRNLATDNKLLSFNIVTQLRTYNLLLKTS
jgi:hypothetical protein